MKTVSFALAKISKHINITAEKYLMTACIEHLREDHLPVTRGPDTNHSTDFQKNLAWILLWRQQHQDQTHYHSFA